MKRLFIVHSSVNHSDIKTMVTRHDLSLWIPFVGDYDVVLELDKVLQGAAERVDIGKRLQLEAKHMRRPFFETTAELGKKYNSVAWWANGIPERNTMRNKLFLYCCYVGLAYSYLKKGDNLCIISDNISVIKNIVLLAKKERYEVTTKYPLNWKETSLWTLLSGLGRLTQHAGVGFLARSNLFYHKHITKKYVDKSRPDIILHTWVDEKCLGADGRFNDRYFTVLPGYLKTKGHSISTLVTLSYKNLKRSLWDIFSFFHTNRESFLIPEDYYRMTDYWFPIKLWFKRSRFHFRNAQVAGVDCSILFEEDNRKDEINFITRYYPLFKRLREQGVKPEIIIDGFENMITDKMIILGVKDFMPATKAYGFYHMAPPPNVLCFFTEKTERDIAPLPDKIICNGERFRDILIKEHFPEEKVYVGAALRYQYLYNLKKSVSVKSEGFRILLILPIEKDAAIELFYKVREAVNGIDGYSMIIKPHPMETAVLERMRKDFLPGTEVFNGAMDEVMNICDVVVSAATSAVLDSIIADKEVVRVGRSTQIDLDPLEWFEEFGSPVGDTDALREALVTLEKRMKNSDYKSPNYSKMLPDLFAPMNEENMKVFLP